LITGILLKAAVTGKITFIPSRGTRHLGVDMSSVLHKHKQTVEAMVYITIFGIDEYIMDKEMTLRGGLNTMFKNI